jgi:L-alanine-DL-glutamate epimerase-like enolase superfamily enzyme
MSSLTLRACAWQLHFKRPFGISHGTRSHTDTLYVQAGFQGEYGYGEAALPPYLGYDANQLVKGFHRWFPEEMKGGEAIREALVRLNKTEGDLPRPLRCAVDIALHDLFGKLTGRPVRQLLGLPDPGTVPCFYTIGFGEADEIPGLLKEAAAFSHFKIKLGSDNDRERIETFRANSDAPFCVDANQGWKSVEEALPWMKMLNDLGCLFVEQPLPIAQTEELQQIHQHNILPILLDESVQQMRDLEDLHPYCDGINVKLVKCGGLEPARELIRRAKRLGKRVLIGCMSESTCGAMAAAQLSAWADWTDLDGPVLIDNDPFSGMEIHHSSIRLTDAPGTGAKSVSSLAFS